MFGIVFLKRLWFWRIGYVAIILVATTKAGVLLLYMVHLGTDVPYGRVTVLLNIFATVLFVQTLYGIFETRRTQVIFTIYLCVVALAALFLFKLGLPEKLVQYYFERSQIPMGEFYALHQTAFKIVILNHGIFIVTAAVIAIFYLTAPLVFNSRNKIHVTRTVLTAGFALVALTDAVLFYSGARESERMANSVSTSNPEIFERHELETALAKDGADFSRYRLHLDMPFEAHRAAVYANNTQIPPLGLSRQWVPNNPILTKTAITSGYSSVIPDGIGYTELLNWRVGAPEFRAHGEYSVLHPGLFDVFAIRYVLRMKSEPKRNLDWRPDVLGPWEKIFRENTQLLYEDEAYQLFKYEHASSLFYFPRRVIYTDSLVNDSLEIGGVVDHFVDRWEPTAFLPRSLFPGNVNKKHPNTIIEKQRAQGNILATSLDDGGWEVVVRTDNPGFLSAGLRYDPWWRVSVDGQSITPIHANGVFMAIPILAGNHTVIFKLEPISGYIGIAISLAGFFFMLMFFVVYQVKLGKSSHART